MCPPRQCGDSFIDFEVELIAFVDVTLGKNLEHVPTIALMLGPLSEEDRAELFAAAAEPRRAHGLRRIGRTPY